EALLGYRNRAARALRHILAGHLGVDTAAKAAFRAMHGEKAAHFREDALERARLVAVVRLDDIAVHRVAGPHDRVAFTQHGAHQRWQAALDLVVTEAGDERHPTRL